HLRLRLRAVLEADAGVLGLGAFLDRGAPHQAGQQRRGRRAVVDRRDVAPPRLRAGVGLGGVGAGVDALAVAARAEAGVQVDPAELRAARAVLAQDVAQRGVAPGGRRAAEEEAVRMPVLSGRDRLLQRALAVLGGEALERR